MSEPRWHRHPHVLWRRSLDSVQVLAPGLDEPFALAGTGPELWELLADPRTTDDIVRSLAAAHGAAPELVAADVVPMLDHLEAIGAIERLTPA